jgi:hypothetical protein
VLDWFRGQGLRIPQACTQVHRVVDDQEDDNTSNGSTTPFMTMTELTDELRSRGWRFLLASPEDMDRLIRSMGP